MAKLSGIFARFSNFHQITNELFYAVLKSNVKSDQLENFRGNRWLYSQTVPIDHHEMDIDAAIMASLFRLNSPAFYNQPAKKITLPEEILTRIQPYTKLLEAIIDGFQVTDYLQLVIQHGSGRPMTGSIWKPNPIPPPNTQLFIDQKPHVFSPNKINVIPASNEMVMVRWGEQEEVKLVGGDLGIILDLRNK